MTERKSRLAKAMDRKPRKDHGPFDLPAGFTTPADTDMAKVCVRVLVKDEEDAALIAAHAMLKQLVTEGAEAALSDSDLLADNKTIYALYKAMRDADDTMYPAFFSQDWMRKILTTDKIAFLLNLYFSCRENEDVMRWSIDGEELEAKIDAVAEADPESALPLAIISDCSEPWLRNAFILSAMRLRAERRALYRTRQLLAHAARLVRGVEVVEGNARAIGAWASAARGELAADEPWGTRAIVDQGWLGVPTIEYADPRNVLAAIAAEAEDKAPPMTPEEEAALDAAMRVAGGVSDDGPGADGQDDAEGPEGAVVLDDEGG